MTLIIGLLSFATLAYFSETLTADDIALRASYALVAQQVNDWAAYVLNDHGAFMNFVSDFFAIIQNNGNNPNITGVLQNYVTSSSVNEIYFLVLQKIMNFCKPLSAYIVGSEVVQSVNSIILTPRMLEWARYLDVDFIGSLDQVKDFLEVFKKVYQNTDVKVPAGNPDAAQPVPVPTAREAIPKSQINNIIGIGIGCLGCLGCFAYYFGVFVLKAVAESDIEA